MQSTVVSHIPAEIWIKIAISLRDHLPCLHGHTILFGSAYCWRLACADSVITRPLSLSQTCKFLRITFSHLLSETLSLGDFPHSTIHASSKSERRNAALMQQPNILSSVDRISIFQSSTLQRPIDPYLLQHLPNTTPRLRFLSLLRCHITSAIVQLLVMAENLNELVVRACLWDDEVGLDWSRGQFGHGLKKLTLRSDGDGNCGCSWDPPRYLQLIAAGLVEFEGDTSMLKAILPALEAKALSLLHVTRLTITIDRRGGSLLALLLPFCQMVEDLRLGEDYHDPHGHPAYHFPLDTMPRLQRFRGPAAAASTLLQQRIDFGELHIESSGYLETIERFPLAFPGLKTLVLRHPRWSDDTMSSIIKQCPALTSLQVTSFNGQPRLERWIEDRLTLEIGGLPRLRHLLLRWHVSSKEAPLRFESEITYPLPKEVEMEREVIEEIRTKHCRDLEEIGIWPGYVWIFHPADDGWSPAIRPL